MPQNANQCAMKKHKIQLPFLRERSLYNKLSPLIANPRPRPADSLDVTLSLATASGPSCHSTVIIMIVTVSLAQVNKYIHDSYESHLPGPAR